MNCKSYCLSWMKNKNYHHLKSYKSSITMIFFCVQHVNIQYNIGCRCRYFKQFFHLHLLLPECSCILLRRKKNSTKVPEVCRKCIAFIHDDTLMHIFIYFFLHIYTYSMHACNINYKQKQQQQNILQNYIIEDKKFLILIGSGYCIVSA